MKLIITIIVLGILICTHYSHSGMWDDEHRHKEGMVLGGKKGKDTQSAPAQGSKEKKPSKEGENKSGHVMPPRSKHNKFMWATDNAIFQKTPALTGAINQHGSTLVTTAVATGITLAFLSKYAPNWVSTLVVNGGTKLIPIVGAVMTVLIASEVSEAHELIDLDVLSTGVFDDMSDKELKNIECWQENQRDFDSKNRCYYIYVFLQKAYSLNAEELLNEIEIIEKHLDETNTKLNPIEKYTYLCAKGIIQANSK
jgi:hypothetical protein